MRGPGVSLGYYVCDPRLFLNRTNIHVTLKEIASSFIPRLLVVFTRQVQILVISLIKYRISSNKRPPLNKCPPSGQKWSNKRPSRIGLSQQLCPCITPFSTFLSHHCTTATSKCLISRSFSFPEIWYSHFRIQLQKTLPTFDEINEMK